MKFKLFKEPDASQEAIEMAQYIVLLLVGGNINILLSWGVEDFAFHVLDKKPGVSADIGCWFRVNGYKFQGMVVISYNEGADTFTMQLRKPGLGIIKEVNDIYLENLQNVVDEAVEKVDDYAQHVEDDLGKEICGILRNIGQVYFV